MINKQLIIKLLEYDENLSVKIFAKGETFDIQAIQIWEENGEQCIELGCGWASNEEMEEE